MISNALKFSKENEFPIVQVTAEFEVPRKVNVRVSDNGIGIPDSQLESVFKLFSRANNSFSFSGAGIGLSLCKKICLKHGADLVVESEINVGSVFSILGLELDGKGSPSVFDVEIVDHASN